MTSSAKASPSFPSLLDPKTLFVIYAAAALAGTAVKLAPGSFVHLGVRYQPLQNFAIFRNAFFHLLHGQDLYAQFRLEQWDQYKYSPTFALLMAPLAVLPYAAGVLVWNLLNMLALWGAVWTLPAGAGRQRAFVLWFILVSATGSMLNAQSNGLMAALMLAGWTAHERDRPFVSTFCIVLATFVKLFGVLALLPCLLYRGQRKLIAGSALWGVLLAAAPLTVVSPRQLFSLYRSWYRMLQYDRATRLGMSVMALLKTRFHFPVSSTWIVLAGAAILVLVPALRMKWRGHIEFRLLVMASVLIWAVMFNHLAESPSFIIAVTGVALWYYFQQRSLLNLALLVVAYAGTCLSSTEIVPHPLREQLVDNYVKLWPCIPVWLKLQYDLLRYRAASLRPGDSPD